MCSTSFCNLPAFVTYACIVSLCSSVLTVQSGNTWRCSLPRMYRPGWRSQLSWRYHRRENSRVPHKPYGTAPPPHWPGRRRRLSIRTTARVAKQVAIVTVVAVIVAAVVAVVAAIIIITRGPWTLALCLTAAVGMTLAIFCRLVSKSHCCRLNQVKSRVNSHTVLHYAGINFRPFSTPYLWPVKVTQGSNVMVVLDSPYMISYWCLIVIYGLTQLPYEI